MLVIVPKTLVVCLSVCGMGMLIPFCCRTDAGDHQAVSMFSVLRRPCGPCVAQFGWTALMEAAAGGHTSTVELLLKHRATVDQADKVRCQCLPVSSAAPQNVLLCMLGARSGYEGQLGVRASAPSGNTPPLRKCLCNCPKVLGVCLSVCGIVKLLAY